MNNLLLDRFFLLTLSVSLSIVSLGGSAWGQTKESKLTKIEHDQAVSFARTFWAKLIHEKDIRPVLKKYAIEGFYDCLDGRDFAFLRADQVRPARVSSIKNYYIAESNFMLLLMLSGLHEKSDADVFSIFPTEIQNAFTKSAWDALERNDSNYEKQSDLQANEYFDRALKAFERANPPLRRHTEKNWLANRVNIKKATKEFEENASYAFEPTLWVFDDGKCGLTPKNRRFIAIDIPMFQLMLTKIRGRFRVVQFPFHID
jgi:hypothetical protein